jgi:ATP-dependent protease ClpP protease subunit
MAKKILISGIIGWDFKEGQLRAQLEEANGDGIELEIDTPGGSVFSGITMFNLIRDYAKNKNNVTATISGMAASMGSYIALAANKVVAYDNSTYFIHNVQSIAFGDYRDMQKEAIEIEALTNLLANAYVNKTGRSKKEIRKLMDDSTFFLGEDIKKNGFADEIITSNEQNQDKNIIVAMATGRIKECQNSMKESKKLEDDIKRAASLIDLTALTNQVIDKVDTQTIDENKTEVKKSMDLKELKNSFPDVYQEAVNIGVNQEKERVNAHIILGKQANAMEKAVEFIQNGKLSSDLTVQAEYMATGMENQMKVARIEDNVPAIPTASADNNSVEDTEKAIAEYKQRFGGKK